jgi:uncharacterized phage protein (TIGR02218 family)
MQVHLFGFTLNQASLYVTNDNVQHVYSGITYNASAITCKEYIYDLKEVMGEANINIPFAQSGFLAGAASRSIEGPVRVEVYEYDTINDDATLIFRGFVNVFKVSKAALDMQCVSFVEHARDNYARLQLSRVCQHRLYSPLCGVYEANYKVAGTISGFSVDRVTIEINGINNPSGYFTYGWVEWKGVYRHIVNDVWNGTSRFVDLLHFAPISWQKDQQITLVAGCDKHSDTCKSKFGNFANFMGFPYAPYESIRYTGLRQQSISRSKK